MRWVSVALLVAGCTSDLTAPPNFDAIGGGGGSAGTVPCDASPAELERCVEGARYEEDLRAFGLPRSPGTDQWQLVQDACFDRLTSLGFETERQVYETGVNVVGRKIGATLPAEVVLVAAHYDGFGTCTAADDNASGVAGALEVARALSVAEFDRTLVVGCWDQEEVGYLGSRSWLTRALADGDQVRVYFNFEMIGFKSDQPDTQGIPLGFDTLFPEEAAQVEASGNVGDFIAVITDDLARASADAMKVHGDRIGLPVLILEVPAELKNSPLLSDLRRSDHNPFWANDVPAMMITDTANFRNKAYHCEEGEDTVARLDQTFATGVIRATTAAAADALGLR